MALRRRQLRGRRACWVAVWAAAGLALPAGGARAAIPEPDHLFFGLVRQGGELLTDAALELRTGEGDAELLARTTPGSDDDAPDFYVLGVRVEQAAFAGEARSPGVARIGDTGTLYVNGVPAAGLTIGGRGLAVRIDLDLDTLLGDGGTSPNDGDGDGVPDYRDNCVFPNPSQVDANGNGVGEDAAGLCEGQLAGALVMRTAEVGSRSNSADSTGFGAVAYTFEIGDTEVSNAQYMEFLNAVAASEDPHGLYNAAMTSDLRGGILRAGSPSAWSYRVKPNMLNKPVNYVSWLDAARYANWLENGKPSGVQDETTTETGAFDLRVAGAHATVSLEQGASWSLPTEDEWYKAAYHDPTRGGAPYWLYPTRQDLEPVLATANEVGDITNPAQEVANYAMAADWNGQDGNLTSVASAGSQSAHGGFDLGGNVAEWLGADAEGGQRVARGGSYMDERFALESIADSQDRGAVLRDPLYEGADVGFRVMSVPEPRVLVLQAAALVLCAALRRVRRR